MGLMCSLIGHRHSGSVWYDEQEFRSACARCGVDMVKDGLTGDWRITQPEDLDDQRRRARPDKNPAIR